ncbi:hypothetical protein [Paractinoplanes globisporus]|uniref:DUF4234 domain-containing protein n=1 Tax=Paractinoplanes globisporus TaxID=113565 RepID=A0ABW6WNP7_9ACTN|nr:hypothetical protein [Actinoplanes globisporus]
MPTRWIAPRRSPSPPDESASPSLPKVLADLGVFIGALTALLYYFGWVRLRYQARELGFDVSALSLGTADYLLNSLSVLFVPVLFLLLVVLGLQRVHRRLVEPFVSGGRDKTVLLTARLLSLAWLPLAAVAGLLLLTPMQGYALPMCLVLAVLLGGYGRSIRRSRTGVDPWPAGTRIVVAGLLAIATFWTTERLARTVGSAFGADIAAHPDQLPAVVLYSAKDLSLDAPGMVATALRAPRAEFGYRYSGLFLLERSGNRYFLVTDHPGRVIILSETADVRMEFVADADRT